MSLCAVLVLWTGCNKSEETPEPAPEELAPEATAPVEKKAVNSGSDLTLAARNHDKLGFSIQLPAPAKLTQDTEFMAFYEYVLPGKMFSLYAKVMRVTNAEEGKLADLKAAEKYALTYPAFAMAKERGKRSLNGGDFELKYEQNVLVMVAYFTRRADGTYLMAECGGPKKLADNVDAICASLKAAK